MSSGPHPSARLHAEGKLSFRRRVRRRDGERPENLPLVEFSEDPPALDELVPDGFDAVEIEVGSGKGAFLMAATEVNPDAFLLGIEAAPSYAEHVAELLAKAERPNGMMLCDNAKQYLRDRVGDGALDRLHVYFLDPWPKRRHKGRRFFTPDVPADIYRVLKPGGYLLVATDNAAYAGQICTVLGQFDGLVRDTDEEQRLIDAGPGHGFSPTSFERKYILEGRVIRRYAFAKRSGE